MAEISKARRQDLIFQLLKGLDEHSGLCPKTIQKRLENEGIEINLRTVRRDLIELSSTHGLCSTETRPERFYPSQDFGLKHELHLNEETLQALMIALNNLKFTSHSYFKNITTEAENAILGSLDPSLAQSLRESKERYHFDYSSSGRPAESSIKDFELIMQAIRQNRTFTCINESPYKDEEYNKQERHFAPHTYILSAGIPYLIAKDLKDGNFKKLRITRLKDVLLREETFTPEPIKEQMSFENLIGGYGGISEEATEFKITCDEAMATYFKERSIHASQKVEKLADGKFQITFRCAYSKELPRLIASFGGCVKAVEPLSLFREVKEVWEAGLKNAG